MVITFDNMSYGWNCAAGDLSNVTFLGHAPIAITPRDHYGYDVSYLWTVPRDHQYTFNEDSFDWPTTTHSDGGFQDLGGECGGRNQPWSSFCNSRLLRFDYFHNCRPEIMSPVGSADGNGDNYNSWSSGPARFDFQAVTCNNPGTYTLTFSGKICSDVPTKWTLTPTAAGSLTSETTANPTYNPPNSITGESVEGTLDLDGATQKKIIVYEDHLARDMYNFGSSQSCDPGNWDVGFGITHAMGQWNCFGSVQHAFDGTGRGYSGLLPDKVVDDWPSKAYAFGDPDAITAAQLLNRGDIVAFYVSNCSGVPTDLLQHAATATGQNGRLWGANNVLFDSNGNAAWRFAQRSVGYLMYDIRKNFPSCSRFYIVIYKRP